MPFLFGGGSQTVVEKSTSEPSEIVKPHLQNILSSGQNLYNKGWGTTYYPGSTVTPFSQASQEAMGGMLQQARGGNPAGMNAINSNMAITGNQGISQGILSGLDPAQRVASGQTGITTGGEYGRLAGLAQYPTASSGLAGLVQGGAFGGGGLQPATSPSVGNSAYGGLTPATPPSVANSAAPGGGLQAAPPPNVGASSSPGMGGQVGGVPQLSASGYGDVAQRAGMATASSGLSGLAQQGANLGGITTGQGYGNIAQQASQPTASWGRGAEIAEGQFRPNTQTSQYMARNGANAGTIRTEGDYRQELGGLQQPGANERYLSGLASGGEIGAGNPYISGIADATERRALDQANAMFSSKGRLGANAAFGDTVGRALSESRNQLYAQDYENARARQMGAAGMISGEQQGNAGLRQGLLSGITGVQGQNVANNFQDAGLKLGAEQQAGNFRLQDAAMRLGAAGQMDQSRQNAINTQMSALSGQTQAQQLNNQNALANAGVRMGAAGQIDQSNQGAAATQLAALGGQTAVGQQNIGNQFQNAGLRLNAAGQIDQSNAQQLQGTLAALGGQTQTQAANIANQVGAGQGIVDAYGQGQQRSLAAQGLSGDLYQNTFAPYERMAQVGSAQEGLQREQTAADIERFNFKQNAPWANLGRYASLVNGGQYGQTNTTSAPGQSPIQGLLSGAGTGAGIAGALGLTGGWGAGAAGLGGLLGLLSDKRAKEDIEKVGKTEGGHNIYTYRYKGDPVTHMGVLAQEVQKKTPEAVIRRPDGLLSVDYSRVA